MTSKTLFAALALGIAATAASAETLISVDSGIGPVMASAETGMTLYTFRKDGANTSNCYDKCAANWPPFTASADAKPEGALAIVERRDGSYQWALDGKPLYFWVGDTAKGDATGDGVGGVWDAVRK